MVTRREFLKLTGVGAAAASTTLLGSPQPLSSLLRSSAAPRQVATLCGECPAGCAIEVTVAGGGILEVGRNPAHPLACLNECRDAESMIRQLDAPGCLHRPLQRSATRGGGFQPMSWPAAATMLGGIFTSYRPEEIAFVLGDYPDHLSDLVHWLAGALGGSSVLRITASSLFDGRITLQDASRALFGVPWAPYFDLPRSKLVYTFGVSGSEPWLRRFATNSGRMAGQTRVHFAPLVPAIMETYDEWVSIRPGSEGFLAQGLSQLIGLVKSGASIGQTLPAEVKAASQASTIPVEALVSLARRFAGAGSALAVPGADLLAGSAGLAAAQAVMSLNAIAGRLGQPGGLYLQPESLLYPEVSGRTATLAEIQSLIDRMQNGQVKALFVHGLDLVADLPAGLGIEHALGQVERLVLFNPLINETSPFADALLPDQLPLESWGYQRISPGVDRAVVSAIQPVVSPRYDTRSTVDLLLDEIHRLGGRLTAQIPFRDETEFLRQAVMRLPWAAEIGDPWGQWLSQGGWWSTEPTVLPPVSLKTPEHWRSHALSPVELDPSGNQFFLVFSRSGDYIKTIPARPGELSQVGIHPVAARRLGLRPGDVVCLATPNAEIDARVVEQAGLRLDTLVLPLEHSRSGNLQPVDLANEEQNESGDLAYQSTRVRVIPVY